MVTVLHSPALASEAVQWCYLNWTIITTIINVHDIITICNGNSVLQFAHGTV